MDRLRWDNIARAAAALAVIALIVAWPHLHSKPPEIPFAAPAPVSVEQAPVTERAPPPAEEVAPVKRPHRAQQPRRAAKRASRAVKPPTPVAPRSRPVKPPTPVPPRSRPVVPRPVPASSDQQGAAEFALP